MQEQIQKTVEVPPKMIKRVMRVNYNNSFPLWWHDFCVQIPDLYLEVKCYIVV